MRMSDDIDKIAPALVEIQESMTVVRDTESVHNAKYAPLGSILATIRPALKSNGLTIIQTMDTNDKVVKCTTRILHSSGQWIDSDATVTAAGLSPQLFGSAISYVRRYGLVAGLSIATPGDDDDAEKAERAYTKAEEKEAEAVKLRKYQAAILPRLMKYDTEVIQMAFEYHGYSSDLEDKEKMLCELIKQVGSKYQLEGIGKRAKAISDGDVQKTIPIDEIDL